jgi:hypothetical protein
MEDQVPGEDAQSFKNHLLALHGPSARLKFFTTPMRTPLKTWSDRNLKTTRSQSQKPLTVRQEEVPQQPEKTPSLPDKF